MTKEEAIKELQESHDMMRSYDLDESESRLMQALNMAISALEQMPEVTSTMQTGQFDYLPIRETKGETARRELNALPSVTQKSGKWINLEKTKYKGQLLPFWGRYECSACKGHGQDDFNFCPNCGACMKDGRTLDEFIEDSKAESEE